MDLIASFTYFYPHSGASHDPGDFLMILEETLDEFFEAGTDEYEGVRRRDYNHEILKFAFERWANRDWDYFMKKLLFATWPFEGNLTLSRNVPDEPIFYIIIAAIIVDRIDVLESYIGYIKEDPYPYTNWIHAIISMHDYNRLTMLQMVYAANANAYTRKHAGNLLLLDACKKGDITTARLLIADGIPSSNCNTALLEVIRSPLMIAEAYGHMELAAVLRGLGAQDRVLNARQQRRLDKLLEAEKEGKRWPNALANARQ